VLRTHGRLTTGRAGLRARRVPERRRVLPSWDHRDRPRGRPRTEASSRVCGGLIAAVCWPVCARRRPCRGGV